MLFKWYCKTFISRISPGIIFILFLVFMMTGFSCNEDHIRNQTDHPNIIIIYVDDLGYGDIGINGAFGVNTPHVDAMATGGVNFTDAHSSASTCTPSRYALLTGSYAFRNDAAILPGDAPLLIRPGTPTLPSMLKKAGYTTAVIGKWHLGLGNGHPQWTKNLEPGPLEVGFDYSFIIPATLDRVPTVFIKNHKVFHLSPEDTLAVNYDKRTGNLPTGLDHPEMLKMKADFQHSGTIVDSISRIGFMMGGQSAWWTDENISLVLVTQMKSFIDKNKDRPFFLYYSLTDIHVPRAPNKEFVGKSTMGRRGDAIAEMDWQVGEILQALKKGELSNNTLIIFTSDNGPVLDDGYDDKAEQLVGNNKPWGPFKGGKYSSYEAGTRMPTIAYWPSKITPGTSDALFSQVDFFASLANLVGQALDSNAAPDSYNVLPVLLGISNNGRDTLLEESYSMALRFKNWKYIARQLNPTPDWLKNKNIATGLSPYPQLYNLIIDTAEDHNLVKEDPVMMAKLKNALNDLLSSQGTRPSFKKRH